MLITIVHSDQLMDHEEERRKNRAEWEMFQAGNIGEHRTFTNGNIMMEHALKGTGQRRENLLERKKF